MKNTHNLESVKKSNRIATLGIIKENDTISRQELAKITGLTPAAITGIVRELVELGFVKEVGFGESSGGRRPVRLRFQPDAGYVIGAEITRNNTTIGIVDLKAQAVKINETFIDMNDPETGISNLVLKIEELVREVSMPWQKICGIGFAFPGLLDLNTQIIKRSPSLGSVWRNIPVRDMFAGKFNVPVYIEHNPNAAALAEYTLGRGKDTKHLAYVNLGAGFSAGIITDNKMIDGFQGHAGEIGHTVVVENGPLCNCGNKGCLESLYSVTALVQKANHELSLYRDEDKLKQVWQEKGKVTIADILLAARETGSYAWNLIRQAGWYIGLVIANVVNFYNPEIICLGGILAEAGSVLMEPLLESVHRHAFPEVARDTKIEISTIGRNAAFYGACLRVIDRIFTVEGPDNILFK